MKRYVLEGILRYYTGKLVDPVIGWEGLHRNRTYQTPFFSKSLSLSSGMVPFLCETDHDVERDLEAVLTLLDF